MTGAADHQKTGAARQKEVQRMLLMLPLQKTIACSTGEYGGGKAGGAEHEQTGAARQKAVACSAAGASEVEQTGAAWHFCLLR